jgi:hypothetical protein
MVRKLFIVFASGLVLAIALLSAAWVVGGPAAMKRIEERGGIGFIGHKHRNRPEMTKSFTFGQVAELKLDMPVDLRFTRGEADTIEISGPQDLVEQLEWKDGRLRHLQGKAIDSDGLSVTIVARAVPVLRLEAPADIELDGLDQDLLDIAASGAVDLDARGKVATVKVVSSGAGDIDLSKLDAGDATLKIEGVGDVDVNASGKVDATIEGAGTVTLHRKPQMLTSKISGIGTVDHNY